MIPELIFVMTLLIPKAGIYQPVYQVGHRAWLVELEGRWVLARQAKVHDSLVGWVDYTALPGQGENIVLNGHTPGVLEGLDSVEVGDNILLLRGTTLSTYRIISKNITLPGETSEEMAKAGEPVLPGAPERVTIVTCMGAHRLIVVAIPK